MKNVLLPVDGSECALRAVSLAIAKISHYRTPDDTAIHLINVQVPFSQDISRFVTQAQIEEFHRSEAEAALKDARALLDAAGLTYTVHARIGAIAEEISQLADELGCDQIVMGTHGRGALGDLLMGSITLKVLHLAQIPILLVK
ncbi:universal stress protein [Propionivibrio dicarboxylicus]|uniref:Nucleotide-binding universal stress protein, UspA family n=1 Tax=Propionivibrio dicarboxylicus TaxID=83767 RepID=A0A1G8KYQ0_9RHOO|nr:universal stress protein [Propionivibrio dicarboxylicus]SDI48598.1 Nucleotide-binding universal stress protein, UspA family [Propionivibrio dicarboxylicus]